MTSYKNKISARRRFLKVGLSGGIALAALVILPQKGFGMFGFGESKAEQGNENFPYQLTDAQWREKLEPDAYRVLRAEGTERSGSSALDNVKEAGVFHCKGCAQPLYKASDKFDSGTGWPSFTQPINDTAIGTSVDSKIFYTRTEVHCSNCGGHLGHVFDDGPAPTGLRYCMNGVAMVFKPA